MTDTTKKSARRWIFIASLALNLFLVGFMAIGAARHHWRDDHPPRHFREMMHYMRDSDASEHFLRHMPESDTPTLQTLKSQHGTEFGAAWAESRAARQALQELIRDGVRDPAQLGPAFARLAETRQQYNTVMQAILLDAARDLSDEGYQNLAGKKRN